MKLKKYENNPILSPNPEVEWENLVTCNPAAWYEDGQFYLIYRAASNDDLHTIQLGLATSQDGFHFERASDKPFFPFIDGNFDGGPEDPRIVKIDDVYYLTYAYRPYRPGQYWKWYVKPVEHMDCPQNAPVHFANNLSATALAFTKDLKLPFKRAGRITKQNIDNRDVILFPEKINGQFVRFERPIEYCGEGYGTPVPSMWINFSDDILDWKNEPVLLAKPELEWEALKMGGSTPPLKTEDGWLVIYHAVSKDHIYRVGVMLLDLNDPQKILSRPPDFIMEPECDYETKGFYHGCVFPTGNVIVEDTLYVYYGAGDIHCGVATCSMKEIMDYLNQYKK